MDSLSNHPANVRGLEAAANGLVLRIKSCCHQGYTGAVQLEVLINNGMISAFKTGDEAVQKGPFIDNTVDRRNGMALG